MATSGSVDFQHSRTQLIESALRKCGRLREGVSASSDLLTSGSLALNGVVKSLATDGMPLWAIKEGAVLPIHDVNTVTLGPSGGHAATTWVHTQTSASAAAAATTITVDSITGISASDQIGVELDSGNIHWTTVSGAPSGSTITLASGLATAASADSHVYTYTSKTVRPLKIIQSQLYNYDSDTEVPINIVSRDEYQRVGSKESEGAPNQIYYDPQLTRGTLHFFPRFSDGARIIKIWFQRPFEDMDSASDNLDFPQEWEQLVILELAAVLGLEMSIPQSKQTIIMQWAAIERRRLNEFNMEEGSIYFTPERYGR